VAASHAQRSGIGEKSMLCAYDENELFVTIFLFAHSLARIARISRALIKWRCAYLCARA